MEWLSRSARLPVPLYFAIGSGAPLPPLNRARRAAALRRRAVDTCGAGARRRRNEPCAALHAAGPRDRPGLIQAAVQVRRRMGQEAARIPVRGARESDKGKKRRGAAAPRRGWGLVLVPVVVARARALVGIAVRVELVCMVVKVVLVARAAVFSHAGATAMPRINRARSPAPAAAMAPGGREGVPRVQGGAKISRRGMRTAAADPLAAAVKSRYARASAASTTPYPSRQGAPEPRQAVASRTRQSPCPCRTRSAPLSS